MTIDTQDQDVAVPHFKDRLWPELARLHEERNAGRPRRLARRGRPPGRRTPGWALSAGAVAASAAAIAVAVAAVQPTGDGAAPDRDVTFAAAPVADRFDPAPGDVVAQLLAATERASGTFVVHMTSQSASGEGTEVWMDWTTERYRDVVRDAQGEPMQEAGGSLLDATDDPFAGSGEPDEVLRIVSHCRRDVTDETHSGMTGTPGWPFHDMTVGLTVPADLTAVADGTEVVDGRELARVKVVETGEVVLVDPATSLPVQSTVQPGTPDQLVVTYEYLPRSEDNLDLLTPPSVPDDYTAVDMGDTQADIDAPPWGPATPVPQPDCPPLP